MSSWDKFKVSPEEFIRRHGTPDINMSEQDPRSMGQHAQNNFRSGTSRASARDFRPKNDQYLAFYHKDGREAIRISPDGIRVDSSVPMDDLVKLFVTEVNKYFEQQKKK